MERQPVLEGERLLLRPLREEDWDGLFAVAADPQIWAVHPAHDRWQEPVFRAFFADALANGGALAVIEKSSWAIVGSSRFQGHDPADGGSVEIGWTFLARRLWGGGFNAEMKRLMLGHALRYVRRVDFRVGEANVISRGAMANIGGVLSEREDITMLAGVAHRHVIYEITQESFARGPLA
ncbi:GNAT family N-acetyltransferase [Parerythrobacter aurantius]|uniref:GNAT family N-acetyltransferase n=1 Tax=Parerythrobacter aurantius TaxID=3127706 RepID=UPI00324B2366